MSARGFRLLTLTSVFAAVAACSLAYSTDGFTTVDNASSDAGGDVDGATIDAADAGDASSIDAALPDGLIAHWPLEGTGADVTGNGHALAGVAVDFVDSGARGGAVRCAEEGSRLESTSPDLSWGPDGVTIFTWIRLEPKDGGTNLRTIFDIGRSHDWTNGANHTLGFGLGDRGAGLELDVNRCDGGACALGSVTAPADDGKFHAVAFVGSPSGMTIYVDGLSAGVVPVADAGALVDPDPIFRLCCNGNGDHFFGGLIDEVMVWNRPLSAEEIQTVVKRLAP